MPANDPHGLAFGTVAETYEHGRPEYPAEIVDWLLEGSSIMVVDVGAGTGKLTRALVGRDCPVIAVEPDAGMRVVLARVVPGVSVIEGRAEDLPLRDALADVVVVGQAWHWVDPIRACPEIARVLRPGGRLGLVWNDRNESDPWVAELSALLTEFGTSPDDGYEPVVEPPFGDLERTAVSWVAAMALDEVLAMIASRSYVIALPDDRRAALIDRVTALAERGIDSHTGKVPVPYLTRGYRWRLPE